MRTRRKRKLQKAAKEAGGFAFDLFGDDIIMLILRGVALPFRFVFHLLHGL